MSAQKLQEHFPHLSKSEGSYFTDDSRLVVTMRGRKFEILYGSDDEQETVLLNEVDADYARILTITPLCDPEMWCLTLIGERFLNDIRA
jgi:hypothetical protein